MKPFLLCILFTFASCGPTQNGSGSGSGFWCSTLSGQVESFGLCSRTAPGCEYLRQKYTSLGNSTTECAHRSSAYCFHAVRRDAMGGMDACFETADQCSEQRTKTAPTTPQVSLGPCKELYSYPLTVPSRTRTVTR